MEIKLEELETLMTLEEAAEKLNVHIETLRRARRLGLLKTVRTGGRGYKVTPQAIEDYIQKCTEAS